MSDATELDILKDVTVRLTNNAIDHMLTGSFAMNYYAQPRMTRDIDIVVVLNINDVKRVLVIFAEDYYVSQQAIEDAIRNQTVFNLVHFESLVKIDMIIRKREEYRKLEFDRRTLVKIADFNVWIVGKEDLILSKLNWAKESKSEMQIRDVKNLISTPVDHEYLSRWAPELGVQDLLKECLNE